MYELYDTMDDRTVRIFPNRKALKHWLASPSAHWLISRGYNWRRA